MIWKSIKLRNYISQKLINSFVNILKFSKLNMSIESLFLIIELIKRPYIKLIGRFEIYSSQESNEEEIKNWYQNKGLFWALKANFWLKTFKIL